MTLLRSAVAVVLGYLVMLSGAWTAQEVVVPHTQYGAPLLPLIALGVTTSVLGGIGGFVTAMLAPARPLLHLIPMAILISVETITLYVQGRVQGPLWFELMAGASLIAGTIVGALTWTLARGWVSTSSRKREVSET